MWLTSDQIIYCLSGLLGAWIFAVLFATIRIYKTLDKAKKEKSRLQREKNDILKCVNESVWRAEKLKLQDELRKEKLEKDDALTRLSAIMSSRLKDGNPNVVDLNDQNRPNKLGEQYLELYNNQWTDAFCAIENFFGKTKTESEIIQILLVIIEQCFTECKDKSRKQLDRLRETVNCIATSISKKPSTLEVDLMQRIKEERKLSSQENVPNLDEILPRLKKILSSICSDQKFLDEPFVKNFTHYCLKLSWLMVNQDPPMAIELKPESDAYKDFREYKTRGNFLNYVVWPSLLLHEGGPLIMKGFAEFTRSSTSSYRITETQPSDRL